MDKVNYPIVSVITPAFNAEKYIRETIVSVQNQSFTNWEMVIADDGSTDQTAKIAQELSAKDSRIRIKTFAHVGLPAATRNRALCVSRGRLVAFLDADDLWEPDKLNLQLMSLARNKRHWGFSNAWRFGTKGSDLPKTILPKDWHPSSPFMPQLLTGNGIPCLTLIIDRDHLKKASNTGDIGLSFDESPELKAVEDRDLALRLSQLSEPDYISEPLAHYRVHSGGISRAHEKNYERACAILKKYSQMGVPKELIRQAENFHAAKLSINRMFYSSKQWRKNLICSSLSTPLSLRDIYLASLALMPKIMAKKMYTLGLNLVYRTK